MRYRFVTEDEVLEYFIRLSTRKRQSLLETFQLLADHAPLPGELSHRDTNDRHIYVWERGRWRIWFWYDGPVNEVRIVEVDQI